MLVKKAYLDTPEGQIHYRMCPGEDDIPLVFIHQTASSSVMYEKIMNLLKGSRAMYAPDTPGFGQSYRPVKSLSIEQYINTLLDFLSGLGIEKFHLFGHHTGASFAVEMAVHAQDRVQSAIFSGLPYMTQQEQQYWLENWVKPLEFKSDGSHLLEVWNKLRTYLPVEHRHRETVDTLNAGARYHEAYEAVFHQDLATKLRIISCPALLICGEIDPMLPYFENAQKDFPDIDSKVVGGGGYNIDLEANEIAEVIHEFISK